MKRLFACLLMVLVFLAVTPLSVAATTLDGLEIEINTNKEEYEEHESISVTHIITNTNDTAVTNIKLENVLPEGYSAKEDAPLTTQVESLAPGETMRFTAKLNSDTPESNEGNVVLTIILFCLGGLVVAGGGTTVAILVIQNTKKKKAKQILSVFLCMAMLGGMMIPASASEEPSVLNLTREVQVGGSAMTLNSVLTYDPIPGEKVNLAVDAEGMLLDAATRVFHVVKEMKALSGTLLYTEDVKEATCEIRDINGNILVSKSFKPGNMWKVEGIGLIVGMNLVRVGVSYLNGMRYETNFKINNVCEKNMESLEVDKGDTDQDGVLNFIENMYHTDADNPDTDGDGLDDYVEMAVVGTEVNNTDTDQNSVSDGEEDTDRDGLTNSQEVNEHGTDPISADTDGDNLSDHEEIFEIYTDPVLADTDEDGKNDGWELENGYDPLEVNTDFPEDEEAPIPDNMTVESDGEVVITPLEDDPLINEDTPGYIGSDPIEVELEEGHDADISISYDPDAMEEGEDPTLYYFDEETQSYEEIPSNVSEGTVSATINKSGKYVLLNHKFVQDVWENDIFKPSELNSDGTIDVVFVIDRSQSMDSNDPNAIRKDVTKAFIEKLREGVDRAALVQFTAIGEKIMDLTSNKTELFNTVDMIENSDGGGCAGSDANAGTNGSAGIREALNILAESQAAYKYIIFLTDGNDTTVSEDYGDEEGTYGLTGEARQKGIIIHTVGLVGTGDVDIDLLKRVAKGTGGNYYLASVGDDAENNSELVEIYDQIESVTIDRHLDSNDDGISDYYTRLICEQKLGTGTGLMNLFNGESFETIQQNADFDGDGIQNGDELQIIENDRGVFVKVNSLPYLQDSDCDGISDPRELELGTSPMKKNGNVKIADVSWLCNSANFESNDYLEIYNNNVLERGAVFIGNAFFGTTLDQTNLYRQVLLDYFTTIDQTMLTSASEATFDAYVEAFNQAVCDAIEDGIIQLSNGDDPSALEEELKSLKDFTDKVGDIYDIADDSKLLENIVELINTPAKVEKSNLEKIIAGVKKQMDAVTLDDSLTPAQKNANLNKLTEEFYDYVGKSKNLKTKIQGKTGILKKIGKIADVVDKVTFVIDVAQDSWDAYKDISNTLAALETVEENLYILDCIINNSDNTYLSAAARDIRLYLSDIFGDQTGQLLAALDRGGMVVTSASLEALHMVIGGAGVPGAIVELVRTFGNLVFNLDDASKAAAETVALAASADILAENYMDHLEGGYAQTNEDLWIAYASYSDKLYICIMNLAELRKQAEAKMASWQKGDVQTACTENATRCGQIMGTYQMQYYMMFLRE